LSRLALLGVLAVALGLGACGRKGPLDPPPTSSESIEPQAGVAGVDANAPPAPGSKKRLPIDVLLN
jgi:predicted small lipoprotein YifL